MKWGLLVLVTCSTKEDINHTHTLWPLSSSVYLCSVPFVMYGASITSPLQMLLYIVFPQLILCDLKKTWYPAFSKSNGSPLWAIKKSLWFWLNSLLSFFLTCQKGPFPSIRELHRGQSNHWHPKERKYIFNWNCVCLKTMHWGFF